MNDLSDPKVYLPLAVKLGNIEEGLKSVHNLYGKLDAKLDQFIAATATINDKANKSHDRLDDITDPHNGDLTIALAGATDWMESKKAAKSIFVGMGLSGVLAGTTLGAWLTKLGEIFGGTGP